MRVQRGSRGPKEKNKAWKAKDETLANGAYQRIGWEASVIRKPIARLVRHWQRNESSELYATGRKAGAS